MYGYTLDLLISRYILQVQRVEGKKKDKEIKYNEFQKPAFVHRD
jgi:hypothetical protein